jgi:Flp pilus assembly protein TadG
MSHPSTPTTAHRDRQQTPRREPGLWRCARRGRQVAARDEGSVAAQVVIAAPLLMMLPLLIVQAALWAFATHAAQAAADQALDAARVTNATTTAGTTAAAQVLDQLATGPLSDRTVTVSKTATTVTVTVTGSVESILPGTHLSVSARASGPIEQFTTS